MNSHSEQPADRKTLRRSLQAKRSALSPQAQLDASRAIGQALIREPCFSRAKKIGCYWPTDGEVDVSFLYEIINKSWYLPLLSNAIRAWEPKRLLFQLIRVNADMVLNKYGILEPRHRVNDLIRPNMLDVVLCPLVGFDRRGNRLGMGQGYYDRTFKRRSTCWHKPTLIGIAHHFQAYDALPAQPWDIPLDSIITDQEVICCS